MKTPLMVPSYRCDVVDYKIKDLCTAGFGVQDYIPHKLIYFKQFHIGQTCCLYQVTVDKASIS